MALGLSRLRARWRTSLHASRLDDALAVGVDPLATEELTLRAMQLVDPGTRAKLARSLNSLVRAAAADYPARTPGPAILRRGLVTDNRSELLRLATRLLGEGPHCLPGLAMVDRLVTSGDSPLYTAHDSGELGLRLRKIFVALEPVA